MRFSFKFLAIIVALTASVSVSAQAQDCVGEGGVCKHTRECCEGSCFVR